jgi:hypothetical protein
MQMQGLDETMRLMTTWRELIGDELKKNGETWRDIVSITLSDRELSKKFENSYSGPAGKPFAAWTTDYVYFPLCYDGMEGCGSAPRNPSSRPVSHQGGR